MDPPLRHWWIQTVNSRRVSDGGEILVFDYAEAIRASVFKSISEPLFHTENWVFENPKCQRVYYNLKAVCAFKEVGLFVTQKVTLLHFMLRAFAYKISSSFSHTCTIHNVMVFKVLLLQNLSATSETESLTIKTFRGHYILFGLYLNVNK